MEKLKSLLLNSFIFFFLTSCAPVMVVESEEKADVDFAAYDTFNFLDVSFQNDSVADLNRPEIKMLKDAIAYQMKDEGYTLSQNPDLWVNIGIVVENKVQTRQTDIREAPVYIGQRRYHWESEDVVVDEYEEGTVTVDIVDAQEMERIWHGVVTGTITDNRKKMEKRIDEGIELLFARYPNSVDM